MDILQQVVDARPALEPRLDVPCDIQKTIEILPRVIQDHLWPYAMEVNEVFMQVYQPVQIQLDRVWRKLPIVTTHEHVSQVVNMAGKPKSNHRIGIEASLSRISIIHGSERNLNGLKLRFGRVAYGVADPLTDLILESDANLMIIGAPSSGKTTLLRGVVHLAQKRYGPSLVVIDTNGEITGSGERMHPYLENFTRVQVPDPREQPELLRMAIKNLSPELIIMDELSDVDEIRSAVEAKSKGVRLITTVHGGSFETALEYELYQVLLGNVDLKSRTRKSSCIFDCAVMVAGRGHYLLYDDLEQTVDAQLASAPLEPKTLAGGNP